MNSLAYTRFRKKWNFRRIIFPSMMMLTCVMSVRAYSGTEEASDAIASRRVARETLRLQVEKLAARDPLFVAWHREQNVIFEALERAARFDADQRPWEFNDALAEWDALLSRMEEECRLVAQQPDLDAAGRLNVRDFGAAGDGQQDDAPAIRRALEALRSSSERTLFFPAGIYRVRHENGNSTIPIFSLDGMRNCAIVGEVGTIFRSALPQVPFFRLDNCENVRFQSIRFESEQPFYSTGIVTGFPNDRTMRVQVDAGILPDNLMYTPCFSRGNLVRLLSGKMAQDGKTPELYGIPVRPHQSFFFWKPEIIGTPEKNVFDFIPPGAFMAQGQKNVSEIVTAGDRIVYYARNYRGLFALKNSNRCRFADLRITSSGGIVFSVESSSGTFITNCHVAPPENARVAIASAADIFWCRSGSLGGYLAGNTFLNPGDDFLNVYGTVRPVLRQEGNTVWVNADHFHPEDLPRLRRAVVLRPRESGFLKKSANAFRIIHFERTNEMAADGRKVSILAITFDRDPGKLATAAPALSANECNARWTKGESNQIDAVYFPDLNSHGMVIADNLFADGVSRVLQVGSAAAVVRNHFRNRLPVGRFIDFPANRIYSFWQEAYYATTVIWRGNRIETPDFSVFWMGDTNYAPASRDTRAAHFYLEDNILDFTRIPFAATANPLLYIRGVDDVVFAGNQIITNAKNRVRFNLKDCTIEAGGNQGLEHFAPDVNLGGGVCKNGE